jgi:nitrate/nitrite transport system substrate-binding protein
LLRGERNSEGGGGSMVDDEAVAAAINQTALYREAASLAEVPIPMEPAN